MARELERGSLWLRESAIGVLTLWRVVLLHLGPAQAVGARVELDICPIPLAPLCVSSVHENCYCVEPDQNLCKVACLQFSPVPKTLEKQQTLTAQPQTQWYSSSTASKISNPIGSKAGTLTIRSASQRLLDLLDCPQTATPSTMPLPTKRSVCFATAALLSLAAAEAMRIRLGGASMYENPGAGTLTPPPWLEVKEKEKKKGEEADKPPKPKISLGKKPKND